MLKIENKIIHVVDGALDSALIESLYEWAVASCHAGWRFGDVADAKYSTNPFWGATVLSEESHGTDDPHDVSGTPEVFQRAWSVLEKGLKPYKFEIRDIFVNGQTYGLDNAIHTDCPKPEEGWYTALFYINPKWHVDWGGETVFYNQARSDIIYAVVPKPGRLVFFDARHHHWGRAPTRNTQDLRVTVAFCLTRRDDSAVP
jgi:SM-20-related protein